ncbi:hypothetical protein E2C01_049968 [Portunus trituberculatus]|uniref:Secreted protein n=1 Tax=Portunus trituberculatus TaxID=210409 RepID=A0A5B7GEU4_PORTR|nr:hypothetical protein [Portunus trituberculatus]
MPLHRLSLALGLLHSVVIYVFNASLPAPPRYGQETKASWHPERLSPVHLYLVIFQNSLFKELCGGGRGCLIMWR